jgi:hypothetical protein
VIVQGEPYPRSAFSADPRDQAVVGFRNLGPAQAVDGRDVVELGRGWVEHVDGVHARQRLEEERNLGVA